MDPQCAGWDYLPVAALKELEDAVTSSDIVTGGVGRGRVARYSLMRMSPSPHDPWQAAGGRKKAVVGRQVRHPAGHPVAATTRAPVCGHHLVATGKR